MVNAATISSVSFSFLTTSGHSSVPNTSGRSFRLGLNPKNCCSSSFNYGESCCSDVIFLIIGSGILVLRFFFSAGRRFFYSACKAAKFGKLSFGAEAHISIEVEFGGLEEGDLFL